jgi:ApaG protein
MNGSEARTDGICVIVESRYVAERSRPHDRYWFFAYTIRIVNEGPVTAQVMGRHWIITDGDGRVQEVRGAGVVGKQPILEPGESFEYTSFFPLETALGTFGTMRGTYDMVADDGRRFEVEIAPFALGEPFSIN